MSKRHSGAKWLGSGINNQIKEVVFSTIPAAGSSEEAIMNAIASDRAPDISENILPALVLSLLT